IIGKATIAMTWKQIREMADAGVDVQSHSLSHPYLTRRMHRSLDEEAYAKWLRHELRESRRILEKETGRAVEFLAYPYGDFDGFVARQAAAAGYEGAFTCVFGRVRPGADLFRINRVVIDKRMDFADFRHYLGIKPMEIANMTPAPKTPVDPASTTVSAKIPKFKDLDPHSVGMALLSAASALPSGASIAKPASASKRRGSSTSPTRTRPPPRSHPPPHPRRLAPRSARRGWSVA